jgi:hypothetical protein
LFCLFISLSNALLVRVVDERKIEKYFKASTSTGLRSNAAKDGNSKSKGIGLWTWTESLIELIFKNRKIERITVLFG